MKRFIHLSFFFLLLAAVCVQCSKDNDEHPSVPPSDTGGAALSYNRQDTAITLQDGRITLNIPAGAMMSGTRVELSTSDARFADSAALLHQFRLLPEGTRFRKPVWLTFHYDSAWLKGNAPWNIGVAFRYDKDGKWYAPINGVVDTVKHTLAVPITHFSHWSVYTCFHLTLRYQGQHSTDNARTVHMPTEAVASLTCIMRAPPSTIKKDNADDGDIALLAPLVADPVTAADNVDLSGCADCNLLAPLVPPPATPEEEQQHALKPDFWFVNGVANGNTQTGTITGSQSFSYHAPSKVPGQNPVAITAGIQTLKHGRIYLVQDVSIMGSKWRLNIKTTGTATSSEGIQIVTSFNNNVFFHLDAGQKVIYDRETHDVYKIDYLHVPDGTFSMVTTAYRNITITGGSYNPETNELTCILKSALVDGTWTATACDESGCQTNTVDHPLVSVEPPSEQPLSLQAQSSFSRVYDTTFTADGGRFRYQKVFTLTSLP
ncbi:hypothetical protein [Compostibacter hankyongensis]|uniref:ZU5 domain-containing protein n=1 Tax=Compostibacter hankyongensis TaxID=1007089 RepID=A0ABP8G7J1_9BACT